MATINQKVDHLNKLTMIAMTSKNAYMYTANKEVCAFIKSLRSEGYDVYEGDELDVYNDHEMRIIDRHTAWITQLMGAEDIVRYEMADDEEEPELELYKSYIRDAENGLMECLDNYPKGIQFFYSEGNDIILKTAPYFLFQTCINYQLGFYVGEEITKSKEFLDMCAKAAGLKNPLD